MNPEEYYAVALPGRSDSGRNPSAVTACPFRGGAWIRYEPILQTAISKPHLGVLWPGCHRLIVRSMAVCFFGRATARHEGLMGVCRLQSHRRCITGLAVVSFLSGAQTDWRAMRLNVFRRRRLSHTVASAQWLKA